MSDSSSWTTQKPIKLTYLKSIRLSSNPHKTRIVFDFSNHFDFQHLALNDQNRIVIKVQRARLMRKSLRPYLFKTPIKTLRVIPDHHGRQPPSLKMTLQLKHPVKVNIFSLLPHGQASYRLVVDLYPVSHARLNAPRRTPLMRLPLHQNQRKITVVIDPGHGGKDPGAIGFQGVEEKNVVLAIAKRLQYLLNRTPGFRAVLTRNNDTFISLRERLIIARRYKADIFIAIHADAYFYRHATGASVYALSRRGATSEAARWLAEKENHSEFMGGASLSDLSAMLRSVLISLQQAATIRESLRIGYFILKQLNQYTTLHSNKVEQAAFVVLKSPDIPSLLIETGFLSNPSEAIRLENVNYQDHLAYAIMQGIVSYFKYHKVYWLRK